MLYTSARCYNFGAEICICAASIFLLFAGVSQCRVVSHRPSGVLLESAILRPEALLAITAFETLDGDDVANNTLTSLGCQR